MLASKQGKMPWADSPPACSGGRNGFTKRRAKHMFSINEDGAQGRIDCAHVPPVPLLLLRGIVDCGPVFQERAAITDVAREATPHPTVWTTADLAPATTSEGQVQGGPGGISVASGDAHIPIGCFNLDAPARGQHGVAGGGTFQDVRQASCVVGGSLVRLRVASEWSKLMRLPAHLVGNGVVIGFSSTGVKEQRR